MAAPPPKADIQLVLVKRSAIDPKQTFISLVLAVPERLLLGKADITARNDWIRLSGRFIYECYADTASVIKEPMFGIHFRRGDPSQF